VFILMKTVVGGMLTVLQLTGCSSSNTL